MAGPSGRNWALGYIMGHILENLAKIYPDYQGQGYEITSYNSASGKRTVVVASEKLLVPATSQRLRIRRFVRSPWGNRFLLHTDITSGEHGSDHWLYEPASGALPPVDAGPGAWFDANAFSPDGQRLLGSRGNLLIIVGTGETNTHVEITEGLVDRPIELGKRLDSFAYPHRDHGLHEGKGTEVHLPMLIIRHLQQLSF